MKNLYLAFKQIHFISIRVKCSRKDLFVAYRKTCIPILTHLLCTSTLHNNSNDDDDDGLEVVPSSFHVFTHHTNFEIDDILYPFYRYRMQDRERSNNLLRHIMRKKLNWCSHVLQIYGEGPNTAWCLRDPIFKVSKLLIGFSY